MMIFINNYMERLGLVSLFHGVYHDKFVRQNIIFLCKINRLYIMLEFDTNKILSYIWKKKKKLKMTDRKRTYL